MRTSFLLIQNATYSKIVANGEAVPLAIYMYRCVAKMIDVESDFWDVILKTDELISHSLVETIYKNGEFGVHRTQRSFTKHYYTGRSRYLDRSNVLSIIEHTANAY